MNTRAQSVAAVVDDVLGVRDRIGQIIGASQRHLVLGGSCAIEIGVVAGYLAAAFEQPGVQDAVLVAGQVDHPGHGPVGIPEPRGSPVGSARGAVTTLLSFRFPGPPAEPGVRLSPHRALHVRVVAQLVVAEGVHGVGIR
jgi:hypothetical protein